jgi:hypothetical protein
LIDYRIPTMNLKECQRLQVCRFKSGASVSSVAGILVSTIIVGFALVIITVFASFALLVKINK